MFTDLDALIAALGWGVVHFLWQGAAIGAAAGVMLALLRDAAAPVRYGVACGALGLCAAAFGATVVVVGSWGPPSVAGGASIVGGPASVDAAPGRPLVVGAAWVWAIGVALLTVRLAVQCVAAGRLKRADAAPVAGSWRSIFDSLKAELGVARSVEFLRSTAVDAPMVVGWLSPVVLAPASAFTSLTTDQLRAILVHELTHIRRRDHLVNAAQLVVEVVLFFHPVVWWLSNRIRVEREHCCDDAAVRAAGGPRVVAEALTVLETLRVMHRNAALAANGGALMNRIARILKVRAGRRARIAPWRTAGVLAAGAVAAGAVVGHAAAQHAGDAGAQRIVETLRDAVEAGAMTPLDAQTLYEATVLPGSERERMLQAELAAFESHLGALVASGEKTTGDVESALHEARVKAEGAWRAAFAAEVLGLPKHEAQLYAVRSTLDALVEQGRLSEQEAAVHLAAAEEGAALHLRAAAHMASVEAEVRTAVEAGELTESEAAAKLRETQARLAERLHRAKLESRLKSAVERGELTEAEARAKLETFGGRPAGPASHQELEVVKARLEAAILAGELTEAEAKARYDAMLHRAQAHDAAVVEAEALRRRIHEALERGEITREEAERKLAEVGSRAAGGAGASKADWGAITARIEAAVARGDLTREAADQRYAEIKAKLAAAGEDGPHAEAAAVRERLKAAVDRGDMSPEEATKRLHEIEVDFVLKRRSEQIRALLDAAARTRAAVERGELLQQEAEVLLRRLKEQAERAERAAVERATEKKTKERPAPVEDEAI